MSNDHPTRAVVHGRLAPHHWYPCEHPDRVLGPDTAFHSVPCEGCATVIRGLLDRLDEAAYPNQAARLRTVLGCVTA